MSKNRLIVPEVLESRLLMSACECDSLSPTPSPTTSLFVGNVEKIGVPLSANVNTFCYVYGQCGSGNSSPNPEITPSSQPDTDLPVVPTELVPLGSFATGRPFRGIAPGMGNLLTLSLTGGGTGNAFLREGKIDIQLDGTTPSTTFTLQSRTGVAIGNVVVNGGLKAFKATTSTVTGVLASVKAVDALQVKELSGATVTIGTTLGSLTADRVSDSRVITGAGITSAARAGIPGFISGAIGKIRVRQDVSHSLFAAGIEPGADNEYGTADDRSRGAGASFISSIAVGLADSSTLFVARVLPKVAKLGRAVDPVEDSRFQMPV